MKIRRGTSRMVDAAIILAAVEGLRAQDEVLRDNGWKLKPRARAYACKDGSLSVQVVWTAQEPGFTCSFTAAARIAA